MRPLNVDNFTAGELDRFEANWARHDLKNGIRAFHHPGVRGEEFFVGIVLKAGTRFESAQQNGIAHFLEHMMFRGSAAHPTFAELAEAFEWLGGEWNAATGHEHTEYWFAGIRHTAREAIPLFAEFFCKPLLNDIEIERQVIIREIEGELNELGLSTDLDYHVAKTIWPNSGLARPICGTIDILQKLTRKDLEAYRQAFYRPDAMTVWAIGGLDANETFQLFDQHFGAYEAVSPKNLTFDELAPFKGPAVVTVENSDNEYEIQIAFRIDGEWSAKSYTYQAICRVLADGFCSRLVRRIREEQGLVYDIDAETSQHHDGGTLDITSSISPDKVEEFFTEVFLVLRELCETGPSEAEMQRVTLRSLVDLELSLSEPEQLATQLCWATLCDKPQSLVKDREQIMAQTTSLVQNTCIETFVAKRLAVVLMGPKDQAIEQKVARLIKRFFPE